MCMEAAIHLSYEDSCNRAKKCATRSQCLNVLRLGNNSDESESESERAVSCFVIQRLCSYMTECSVILLSSPCQLERFSLASLRFVSLSFPDSLLPVRLRVFNACSDEPSFVRPVRSVYIALMCVRKRKRIELFWISVCCACAHFSQLSIDWRLNSFRFAAFSPVVAIAAPAFTPHWRLLLRHSCATSNRNLLWHSAAINLQAITTYILSSYNTFVPFSLKISLIIHVTDLEIYHVGNSLGLF